MADCSLAPAIHQALYVGDVGLGIVVVGGGRVAGQNLGHGVQPPTVNVQVADQLVEILGSLGPTVVGPVAFVIAVAGRGADVADGVGETGDAFGPAGAFVDEEGQGHRRVNAVFHAEVIE